MQNGRRRHGTVASSFGKYHAYILWVIVGEISGKPAVRSKSFPSFSPPCFRRCGFPAAGAEGISAFFPVPYITVSRSICCKCRAVSADITLPISDGFYICANAVSRPQCRRLAKAGAALRRLPPCTKRLQSEGVLQVFPPDLWKYWQGRGLSFPRQKGYSL